MNVRLVAYRKAASAATATTAYNLDLQEAPNVSLNFQFSDVKEPETRKGSYSQTFKLPFTDNNNQFFQDWYNVNLDTLVFSTRTKFDAILYVGTVPQMEGSLQLKSVYKKAQVYEVVLMSSSSSLFSIIGERRLKDVFLEDNGSYSTAFNHVYNETNLAASWGNSLQNTAGTSLYDGDAGVSQIVYPISVTQKNFYYNLNDLDADGNELKRHLRLDQTLINALASAVGIETVAEFIVSMSQFRPSIQLKTMVDLICAKAGFSYSSNFLNGSYFGKLFMTTGNHLELSAIPTTNSNANPSGYMDVGNSASWGTATSSGSSSQSSEHLVLADTTTPTSGYTAPQDSDNIWNETYHYFTKQDVNMSQVKVRHIITTSGSVEAYSGSSIDIEAIVRPFDVSTNTPILDYNYASQQDSSSFTMGFDFLEWELDLSSMPTGASAQIVILVSNYAGNGTITVGALQNMITVLPPNTITTLEVGYNLYSNIRIDWVGYSTDIYGATVDIPACIDPDITQKDFLKDIVQRFNLVVLTDPEDDTNLIIEPYNDFIASGKLKYWTDKLDLDKEIVIKDTTEIQKKTIHLSDQEDEDLYNKEFKERFPDINVYGHLKIESFNNDFATGELKNHSIFSPFINSQVFASSDTQLGTYLPNFSPQYEISYEDKDGIVESKIVKTKPKLFFYGGTASTVKDISNATVTYYLHRLSESSGTVTGQAFSFTTYPVCSPFDISPGSDNISELTTNTKSLYWNSTPPLVPNLIVFNYDTNTGSWFQNSLYGLYWQQYLDNIYSSEARIMECYLNLNEVDIFNFSFADEIFIKDSYWRILKISNYQVGTKASTKVMLIKSLDTKAHCEGCDYVVSTSLDNNLLANEYYLWCPEGSPGCTPNISTDYLAAYANPECCICYGGEVMWNLGNQASNGLYPCKANSGSLPIKTQSIFATKSILNRGQLKTLIYNKLGGLNTPLVRGVNNSKYSKPLLPLYGDDIVIKYATKKRDIPQLEGEAHRIILSGNTNANTRGYAYPEADAFNTPLKIPNNTNMIFRVKGIATVVGGTSSSYPLGTTEGFAYYTAFKNVDGTITQLGTTGGTPEFALKEASAPTSTCTLYIDISNGILRFGLDDNQTDTKRVWQLSAEIDVNRINNMTLGYGENWAIYQNSQNIELQNGDYLIWN